jgi:hypothetical protein
MDPDMLANLLYFVVGAVFGGAVTRVGWRIRHGHW